MDGFVISPELALVDPAAAAAHRSALPRVVLDSAIFAARAARARPQPRLGYVASAVPVWLAVTTYVVVKIAMAVLFAIALVGSAALAVTLLG